MTDAVNLASLSGQAFTAPHRDLGLMELVFPDFAEGGWPRRGAEGEVVPVVLQIEDEDPRPSVFKHFHAPAPERERRARFLNTQGLSGTFRWMFQCIPYAWLGEVEGPGGIKLYGHVARQACAEFGAPGESFENLLRAGAWDARAPDAKRLLARDLAEAVAALDQFGLVHGDVAADNLMIGPGPDGRDVCVLVDFDSYHASGAPALPRFVDGAPARALGSDGFRHPGLQARLDAGDADDAHIVDNDRFALAVAVCELVAWTQDDLGRRPRLMSPQMIAARSLDALEPDVRARFPEGFEMLERALAADDLRQAPDAYAWVKRLNEAPARPPAAAPAEPAAPRAPRGPKSAKAVAAMAKVGDAVKAEARRTRSAEEEAEAPAATKVAKTAKPKKKPAKKRAKKAAPKPAAEPALEPVAETPAVEETSVVAAEEPAPAPPAPADETEVVAETAPETAQTTPEPAAEAAPVRDEAAVEDAEPALAAAAAPDEEAPPEPSATPVAEPAQPAPPAPAEAAAPEPPPPPPEPPLPSWAVRTPVVRIYKRAGSEWIAKRPARLLSPEGDFGALDPRLSSVKFRRVDGRVRLEFRWPHPVWRRAPTDAQPPSKPEEGGATLACRGDRVASNGWRFEIMDESDWRARVDNDPPAERKAGGGGV